MSSFVSPIGGLRKDEHVNNSGLQKIRMNFLSHKRFCWLQREHRLTNRVLLAVNQERAAQKNPDRLSGGSIKAVLEKGESSS